MRRIRYAVASSLDGYIAGPDGEADWIIMDPEIDFSDLFKQFDTWLVGRRTYEAMPEGPADPRMQVLVFSRTLRPEEHPEVRIVADRIQETLDEIRSRPGKDLWLFGGGGLFRSLLDLGQVDSVEVAIIPVLLGGGTPLLPSPAVRRRLSLTGHRVYKSGIVSLEYAVERTGKTASRSRMRSRTRR